MSLWTTLRDDLMPWRWGKDDNKQAWLRRAAEAAAAFTGGQSLLAAAPEAATASTAAAAPSMPGILGTSGVGPVANGTEYSLLTQGANPYLARAGGAMMQPSNSMMALKGMGLLGGGDQQRQPYQPPPPPQAQFQPAPVNAGYQSAQTGMPDPSDPDYLKKLLAMMQAQRGMQ